MLSLIFWATRIGTADVLDGQTDTAHSWMYLLQSASHKLRSNNQRAPASMTFPCYDESHSLERSSPFVKITAPLTWVSRLKPIDKRVSRKLVVVDMTFTDYFGIYPNRTSGFMLEIVLDMVSRLCAGSGSRDLQHLMPSAS